MRANTTRGSGFRGVLDYALGKKEALIVGGNMCGLDPASLAAEFAVSRRLRECRRPVWHTSLSLTEGEQLSPEKWGMVCREAVAKVGLDPSRHQYVAVLHADTTHQHVHIMASRIGIDGTIWHGRYDFEAIQKATHEIEQELGLVITRGPALTEEQKADRLKEGPKVKLTKGEREMWARKGVIIPPKLEVAQALEDVLATGRGTIEDLKAQLAARGIEVKVNQAKATEAGEGRINGLRFVLSRGGEECSFTASHVHKKYAWANLEKMLATRLAEVKDLPRQAFELRDRIKALAPEADNGAFDLNGLRSVLAIGNERDRLGAELEHLESEMERLGVVDPAKVKKTLGHGLTPWPPSR